ncbi:MAG: 16S rRNA (guanine(966)-N(2))-methyltransferase RsmD [Corallococcus sp.]|nr:16S rRNA (guanine(966)-N(2))-methyltransferase RsmD [Corallococcus sp.]MCM1359454.1 16S rRNA (guanine(966)-N(2))-methyltransferase RsmD [Corallococcus sp.]MCM1394734.1 16S rRNA (guanine(966)-N(2))-methyltransferase RsmD [Corallococcus sp.]
MRVITGKYKGRALVAPKNDARPTLDRTKETLFNILNPVIRGASVLDLFAGSGQLAIECLSRGAEEVVLCDKSPFAAEAIKINFQKIGEKPELFLCDYGECLSRLQRQFDLVFLDPPYKSGLYLDVLQQLDRHSTVKLSGTLVCEHSADDDLPHEAFGFSLYDQRKIGTVKFSFYKKNGY